MEDEGSLCEEEETGLIGNRMYVEKDHFVLEDCGPYLETCEYLVGTRADVEHTSAVRIQIPAWAIMAVPVTKLNWRPWCDD